MTNKLEPINYFFFSLSIICLIFYIFTLDDKSLAVTLILFSSAINGVVKRDTYVLARFFALLLFTYFVCQDLLIQQKEFMQK